MSIQTDRPISEHGHPKIVAVVATYHRDACLERLMSALDKQSISLHGFVVADNACLGSTRALVEAWSGTKTEYVPLPDNPGCGAGLAAAMRHAISCWGDDLYFCVFDDDAVPETTAVESMYTAIINEKGWAAAPMLVLEDGKRDDGPEVKPASMHKVIKSLPNPQDVLDIVGSTYPEFRWCKGVSLMISPEATHRCGFHRADMWMLGEDIEYSMRLSAFGRCLFVPNAVVHHLPPKVTNEADSGSRHRVKFVAMLQNLCFMGMHLKHTQTCLRYLPKHILRYLRVFPDFTSWRLLARALWNGVIIGEPAGAVSGQKLRKRALANA